MKCWSDILVACWYENIILGYVFYRLWFTNLDGYFGGRTNWMGFLKLKFKSSVSFLFKSARNFEMAYLDGGHACWFNTLSLWNWYYLLTYIYKHINIRVHQECTQVLGNIIDYVIQNDVNVFMK